MNSVSLTHNTQINVLCVCEVLDFCTSHYANEIANVVPTECIK